MEQTHSYKAREKTSKHDVDAVKNVLLMNDWMKGNTYGPDSTMTEPTLCVFSNTSLHSPDNSTFFPRKFSNSKTANYKTGTEESVTCNFCHQRSPNSMIFSDSFKFQHIHLFVQCDVWSHQLDTLYVAPAPPWPFSTGSWSGVPCCSVIFPL